MRLYYNLNAPVAAAPFRKGILAAAVTLFCSTSASAFEFSLGDTIQGSLDVTASYSASWRLDDVNEAILNPNNDDGNRAFEKGDLTSSLGKITYDLEFKKRLNADTTLGFFNRGLAFHDAKIADARHDHDSPFTLNGNAFFGGSLTDVDRFTEKTEDRAGTDLKWLDAFLYLNANTSSEHASTWRIGSQVINWGESLFIQSGIQNAVNPADVTQANLPGTEVKEILLPQESLYGSIGLSQNVTLEAYYQWEWEPTIAPPVGTYLSSNDFIARDGGETLLLPALPSPPFPPNMAAFYHRGADIEADDHGQYGVALRWFAEALNDTELGFYYLNYHAKLPSLALAGMPNFVTMPAGPGLPPATLPGPLGPNTYHIEYFEDIQLLGVSFNTVLFDTAFSGEIAWHKDVPLQTVQVGPAALGGAVAQAGEPLSLSTPEEMLVAQLTINKNFNNTPFFSGLADDVGFLMEIGYVNTPDLGNGEVYRGPNATDRNAWGYKSRLTLTYFDGIGKHLSALSGTDLVVQLMFNHDVEGTSVIPAGSFSDNAKSAAIAFNAIWQNKLEVQVRYNDFFGDGDLIDRDNASLSLKYRF